MKEITKCIGEIGQADSTIFTTLDLMSRFWPMQLDEESQKLKLSPFLAKVSSIGSRHPWGYWDVQPVFNDSWKEYSATFPMNWSTLMTDSYTLTPMRKHLEVLNKVLARLHKNHLKIKLEKCVFRNKKIYPHTRRNPTRQKQVERNQDTKPPTDIKTIRSFMGLCNLFQTHIKDFALIAVQLFRLTQKDSGYKSGPLPDQALQAFYALQKLLTLEPVMAFPKADWQYELITDAAMGTANTPGGLGAIITQVDKDGNFYAILFASWQLKDHEKSTIRKDCFLVKSNLLTAHNLVGHI